MQKKELLTLMLRFTEALVHNKPDMVPMSKNCKATYQGVVQPLGTGELWGLPRRIPYRQTFVDSVTNNVCFTGVVTNHVSGRMIPKELSRLTFEPQKWWIYYVRIKADDSGRICQIEEIARRETAAGLVVTPAQMEPPRFLESPIPEEERSTREEMIRIGSLYWDGVHKLIDPSRIPFHPDARRIEVGTPVSDVYYDPYSVRTQCDDVSFWWKCIKRRYPVVDVDRGILISTTHMLAQDPNAPTGYVTDIFKIENGLIKYVYAFHDWEIEFVDWEGEGPQTTAEM